MSELEISVSTTNSMHTTIPPIVTRDSTPANVVPSMHDPNVGYRHILGRSGLWTGYTKLFQPDRPVTKAQAAVALASGEASDIVSEKLNQKVIYYLLGTSIVQLVGTCVLLDIRLARKCSYMQYQISSSKNEADKLTMKVQEIKRGNLIRYFPLFSGTFLFAAKMCFSQMNNGLRDTNCKNGRVEIIPNDQRTWFAVAHLETKRFRGEGANNQVAINTDSTIFGSSVPSAFVLWIMRELPPSMAISVPVETRTLAFVVTIHCCIVTVFLEPLIIEFTKVDLKDSNILLDLDMNPKISDFGIARSFCGNETQANTERVAGPVISYSFAIETVVVATTTAAVTVAAAATGPEAKRLCDELRSWLLEYGPYQCSINMMFMIHRQAEVSSGSPQSTVMDYTMVLTMIDYKFYFFQSLEAQNSFSHVVTQIVQLLIGKSMAYEPINQPTTYAEPMRYAICMSKLWMKSMLQVTFKFDVEHSAKYRNLKVSSILTPICQQLGSLLEGGSMLFYYDAEYTYMVERGEFRRSQWLPTVTG
ncbi:concanavalin A-like lectin/glucanase domain, Serine/threonine-protein kinase pim-1/2/3 [Artemisia annua]|uniref:Concanavalin A-like lectin/glucanase domain, Serine/threonine-protein kinase pim-1/2/3 n=1 Tax=Artemisia annua TaxID=35608 RepID=A0A2U1LHT7_ARTAN|nr:concanavalin A-like lectin/glucanase domain, Serine/threonine-protein kinase pim-1/2/3 [Artemisia annua]